MSNIICALIFDYWRQIKTAMITQEYKASWYISIYSGLLTRYYIERHTFSYTAVKLNFRPLHLFCKPNLIDMYSYFLIRNKGSVVQSRMPNLYFCSNMSCVCKIRNNSEMSMLNI